MNLLEINEEIKGLSKEIEFKERNRRYKEELNGIFILK